MDIKKFSQIESLPGINPTINPTASQKSGTVSGGPSFADTLGQTLEKSQTGALQGLQKPVGAAGGAQSAQAAEAVKFSNHAIERMMSRGIHFNKEDLGKLGDAVQRAADKGSRDSLILMNDSALIVSVKNKTVVTVMDKNALKENVFTNIDSTIVM